MYESMNMRGRHPTQRQFKAGVPEDGRPLHSGVPGFVRYRDLDAALLANTYTPLS